MRYPWHLPSTRITRHPGLLASFKPILELVIVAIFVIAFLAQPFRIPSASMLPTLHIGDFLLVDKQTFAPARNFDAVLPKTPIQTGDIIVFHYPVSPDTLLVKRVIGLPGDRLRLRHGKVYRNGQLLSEPYAFYSAARSNPFRDDFPSLREADPNVDPDWWLALRKQLTTAEQTSDPQSITVPPDHYFVLGDNRNDSEDSRYWGFVPRSAILGRPMFLYFNLPPPPTAMDTLAPTDNPLHRLREVLKHIGDTLRIVR